MRAHFDNVMKEYAEAKGGSYRPFALARNHTAHPLGGCRMGSSVRDGVVSHRGEVFDPESVERAHAGLFIADGSIVPGSVGSNPLLTITALAERIAEQIAGDSAHSRYFQS